MIKGKKKLFCAIASTSMIIPNTVGAYANIAVVNEVKESNIMEVVKTSSLNVRGGAGTNYKKIGTLKKGNRVTVLSVSGGWAKINYNGKIGYASLNYLEKVKISEGNIVMKVKTGYLNVRKGSSTKNSIIGKIYKGDEVLVVSKLSNGWVKIEFNGGYGYVSNVNNAYLEDVVISNPDVPSTPDTSVTKYSANEAINFRKTANWKGEVITVIKKGVTFDVISIDNGWAKSNYNGEVGFVPVSHITKVDSSTPSVPDNKPSTPDATPSTKKQMVVKVDDLSVRTGSSTKYKKIGSLNKGDKVTIIEELSNGWVKIEFNSGEGYVSNVKGAYLEETVETNQEKADKVIAMIDALKDKVDITLDDYEAVMEAKEAYDELNQEEKDLVKNSSKLTDAITKIEELEDVEIDKYNEIVDIIRSFEEEVTVTNVAGERAKLDRIIEIAETMHWSEAQNLPVSRIEAKQKEIEAIEAQIANAQRVSDMIDALNKDITIDDKDSVVNARNAYDALTEEEKALVLNKNILVEAEEKIALLENPVAPDVVKAMIADLDKVIEITDEDAVKKARMAYNSLSQEQQALVGDITVLENAEAKIESIMERVGQVIDLIDALPVKIELTDEQQIVDATTAFNNLSVEEQNKIPFPQRGVLESANAVINSLKKEEADKVIVAELISRINTLKDVEINIDEHENEIKEIRAKYGDLPYVRQNEVTNYDELEKAEWKLDRIYEAVIYLEGLIEQLPEQIEREHGAIVEEAKKRYEDLGEKNQSKVKPENKLKLERAIEQAEALKQEILQNNEEVKNVADDIEALPEIEVITIDNDVQVYGLVRRYVALEEDVKFAVDTTRLENAFDRIETLKAEKVVELINNLPSIDKLDLTHSSELKEVRAKYEEISMRNNNKVTNINVLAELEVKMLELENVNPTVVEITNKIKDLADVVNFDNFDETVVKVEEIHALLQTITDAESDLVPNISKYEEVITELDILSRVYHVTTGAQVVDMINALPEVALIDFGHGDDLTDIKNAYEKISADEKLLVNNLDKLQQAGAEYERVMSITNNIISAIHRIPAIDKLTINDEQTVLEAKNLYETAEEKVKHYINHINIGRLENALIKIEELKNAQTN